MVDTFAYSVCSNAHNLMKQKKNALRRSHFYLSCQFNTNANFMPFVFYQKCKYYVRMVYVSHFNLSSAKLDKWHEKIESCHKIQIKNEAILLGIRNFNSDVIIELSSSQSIQFPSTNPINWQNSTNMLGTWNHHEF